MNFQSRVNKLNAFDLDENYKKELKNIKNFDNFYTKELKNINGKFDIIILSHVIEHIVSQGFLMI